MKNILTPIIILLILLCLIFTNLIFLKKTTSEMAKTLQAAETAARNDDFDTCSKEMDKFTAEYEKYEPLYAVIIRHFELDEICSISTKATEYVKVKDKGMVLGEITDLKERISHLYKIEQVNARNVL